MSVTIEHRPRGIAENDEAQLPLLEVLLISQIFVGRNENIEARFVRRTEQITVGKYVPTKFFGFCYRVTLQKRRERRWGSMIKEDPHLFVSRSFQAAGGKVQNSVYLLAGNVEPFQDLLDGGARFEILKYGGNRHASSAEYPRTAHTIWNAFNSPALRPI